MIIDNNIRGTVLHWCLFAVFVLGFGVFLAPVFTGILNIGNTVGMLFFGALAVITLFKDRFTLLLESHRIFKGIFITVTVIAAILIIIAAVISVFMIKTALNEPKNPSVMVILGCRVKEDRPSLMLSKRINAAYEQLVKHPESVCILSGGQGSDEIMSEAECMYRELTAKGISPDRLFKEERSTNTYENIRFSLEIMEKHGLKGETAIVTSEFHQMRATIIARKQGLEAYSVSAPTALFLLPTYWVRDCLGVAYEIVF